MLILTNIKSKQKSNNDVENIIKTAVIVASESILDAQWLSTKEIINKFKINISGSKLARILKKEKIPCRRESRGWVFGI